MSVLQNTAGQGIKFSSLTNLNTIKTFSLFIHVNAVSWDSLDSGQNARIFSGMADAYASGNDIGFDLLAVNGGSVFQFRVGWSTTIGVWTFNLPSINTWHDIMITYAGTATSANPVAYINGSSVTVTEIAAPAGTWAGLKNVLKIGNRFDTVSNYAHTFNGKYKDVRCYSVIKTPTQVANISNEDIETDATIDESSLIFHSPFTMCKELTYSTFVGSVLGASNEFLDRINGYVGVPNGSPVGA